MLKFSSVSGVSSQTPLGERLQIRRSHVHRPIGVRGFLPLAIAASALAIFPLTCLARYPNFLDPNFSPPGPPTQFRDTPLYMTSVELMIYRPICVVCVLNPFMFMGPLSTSRKNQKFSQYLSPQVIYRFTPLDLG